MDELMNETISNLDLGPVKEFNGMTVIPLFSPVNGPEYLTLKEALEEDLLIITEVSEHGRVGELKVKNLASTPVLLLDGEEIIGAKQNRVLNTTILIAEGAEIIIPVSCTEQGRWSYKSRRFRYSDVIAAHRVRRSKSATVKESLRRMGKFQSNQHAVWREINCLQQEAETFSQTSAMKDIYNSREASLRKFQDAFPYQENQKGLIVMINGEVAGFEVLSSDKAYKLLHGNIIKSYALEAILSEDSKQGKNILDQARHFLDVTRKTDESRHKSLGYGYDHRFEGKGVVGSSLIYNDVVIHTAFFKL